MSEIIAGDYYEVQLRDGRVGNYEVAQRYYRDFNRLAHQQPKGFNKLCAYILDDPEAELASEHKAILAEVGLALCPVERVTSVLLRPEEEIKEFVCLAAKETIFSRLFCILAKGSEPSYHLVSPFKKPGAAPDEVPPQDRTFVKVKDWAGSDITEFPGVKLHTRIDIEKNGARWRRS